MFVLGRHVSEEGFCGAVCGFDCRPAEATGVLQHERLVVMLLNP